MLEKVRRVRRAALVAICLVIVLAVATAITLVPCKILYTQVRMANAYLAIRDQESVRVYNQNMALQGGLSARYYQSLADEADQRIVSAENIRTALENSSDAVIAWAARNDFDLFVAVIGILGTLLAGLFWYVAWKTCLFFAIARILAYALSNVFAFIFSQMSGFFDGLFKVFEEPGKPGKRVQNQQRTEALQKKAQKVNNNIIKFRGRKCV